MDEDGAADFVMLMSDEYIARYHNDETDRTQAMSTYLSMGIVSPSHASLGRWHAIAQRTSGCSGRAWSARCSASACSK